MILSHSFVGAEDAPYLGIILHGVLGAGHNLRSFAKNLAMVRPEFRFCLADLRYHGKSLGAAPPHELASCVNDLFDLSEELGRAPRAVIGHSLGGKVALAYGKRHESKNPGERGPSTSHGSQLRQVWALDSNPGAQEPGGNHQVQRVLQAIVNHPGPFARRLDVVAAVESEGLSSALANWLATSINKTPEGFVWRFDVAEIGLLLEDYFRLDLWPFLETRKAGDHMSNIAYELLLAENSDRWSGDMKEKANCLKGVARVNVHHLPDSGHWVHVDNPDGLLDVVANNLVR